MSIYSNGKWVWDDLKQATLSGSTRTEECPFLDPAGFQVAGRSDVDYLKWRWVAAGRMSSNSEVC